MKFRELAVAGAYEIEPELRSDERGFFARVFCTEEMAALGIDTKVMQANCSYNERRATLRGLHLQLPPHGEAKTVACTAGRVFDVVADLRPDSPTFLRWDGVELSAVAHNQLHAPVGCAHGFVTLDEHAEVRYLVSAAYAPDAEAGVRWDDPALAIQWPVTPTVVSERDGGFPLLDVESLRAGGLATLRPARAG